MLLWPLVSPRVPVRAPDPSAAPDRIAVAYAEGLEVEPRQLGHRLASRVHVGCEAGVWARHCARFSQMGTKQFA